MLLIEYMWECYIIIKPVDISTFRYEYHNFKFDGHLAILFMFLGQILVKKNVYIF